MPNRRAPPPLKDMSGTIDESVDENTVSFGGNLLPDPPSTLSQSSKRRTRLWNQLQEATTTATTADDRSVIEHRDLDSEDHSAPMWKHMVRQGSTITIDESSIMSKVANQSFVRIPCVGRPGSHDVQLQAACGGQFYSDGTRELMRQLERETEEEIEYLEELVESLTGERDQLKGEVEQHMAQIAALTDKCTRWAANERQLRQQNDELRSALLMEKERTSVATTTTESLQRQLDERFSTLHQAIHNQTAEMLDQRFTAHTSHIVGAIDQNPTVSALVSTNQELRKEVDMLRYENSKQRGEMFNILIEMRRLQSGKTKKIPNVASEGPPTSHLTPIKTRDERLLSLAHSSSSEWSTSDEDDTGTGTATATATGTADKTPNESEFAVQRRFDPTGNSFGRKSQHKTSASA